MSCRFFSNNPGIQLEISIDNLALLWSFFGLRNEGTTANFVLPLVGKQCSVFTFKKKKKKAWYKYSESSVFEANESYRDFLYILV